MISVPEPDTMSNSGSEVIVPLPSSPPLLVNVECQLVADVRLYVPL